MRNVVVAQFVVIMQCLFEGTEKTMKSFSIPGLGVDIWKPPPNPNKYKQGGKSIFFLLY